MKKFISTLIIGICVSVPAFAAKFEKINSLTNSKLERLATEMNKILSEPEFSNLVPIGETSSYSFTRNRSEKDINTIKQLNVRYMGLYPHDEMGATGDAMTSGNGSDIIDALFLQTQIDQYTDEEQVILNAGKKALLSALLKNTDSLRASGIKYFAGDHSDEDGSWGVIDILDTENNEVLVIRMGYSGT